jgi:hypothetical protein
MRQWRSSGSNRRWRLKTLRDERIGEAVSGGEGSRAGLA